MKQRSRAGRYNDRKRAEIQGKTEAGNGHSPISQPRQQRCYPAFADLMDHHMRNGTRPQGTPDQPGTAWTPKTLAFALGGVSDRTVRNWRHGKNRPVDLTSIEREFFGGIPAYAAELQALRAAHSGRASADENIQRARRIVPPNQCIGREAETANVVAALTKQARSVIVLGPPGVGKTTLTRQVMSSPLVAEHFGDRRWLVELDTVRDVLGLCDAVLLAMGMDPAFRSFSDALDQLERCGPTLLVLDNLETPWEAQMVEVEACLQQMIAVPGLSLLASMRGNVMPPLPDVVLSVELKPLAMAVAQLLFLRLAGGLAPDDPHLNPLLAELAGIPLAIKLVAYRAAPHDTLEDLWDEWRERGIALATRPDIPEGRLTSVV